MVERFNENPELDYSELEVFVPELEDLHGEVERGMGPEQQRDLTEEEFNTLIHKDTLTKEEMEAVVKYANEKDYYHVSLDGLTSLDAETAGALAEFKGGSLSLDGLTSLDVEIARALAEFKGNYLYLNGLTSLDAETAGALAEFKGGSLSLDGLTSLDVEIARALAEFKRSYLSLGGLTSLDAETARALAELKGDGLYLGGLTSLDAETARALAEFKGNYLHLNGLKSLDVETALALVEFKGKELWLIGIETVSDEVARILIPIKSKIIGLENKINEVESRIMGEGLNGLQRRIENTKKKKDWKEERGNIEYKMEEHEIRSWGNTVEVERKSKDTIKLKGFNLILTLEEGMWLANFKNRFKHRYPGQNVGFKKDKLNKKLAIRKTLCVGNTMLMSRHDLVEHLPYLESDGLMEALVKWLNS